MDEKQLAILIPSVISSVTAVLVIVVTRFLSKRSDNAKATADEGDAAESLSTASRTLVETYNKELVMPLRQRIDELVQQIAVIEEDRYKERDRFQKDIKVLQQKVIEQDDKIARQDNQIEFMKGELRRSDSALEFNLSITKDAFPDAAVKALKIRRGEL